MIRSMTGYGAAVTVSEALRATAAVRSLNHRYLDVTVHLSRGFAPLESDIRSLVQSRFSRGRVEVSLHGAFPDETPDVIVAHRPLVAGLVRALREIQSEHGLAGEVRVSDIARFPGALEVIEETPRADDRRRGEVIALVGRALESLEAMRRAEGEQLAASLEASLDSIEAAAVRVEALSEAGSGERRAVLLDKLRGLCSELALEEGRLYQEVVRLADRHDVSEEVQRLRSHLGQARGVMGEESTAGKRLDFLAQELMREANTIGSKAAYAPLVHEVVRLKSEIEKLREQVQNVE